MENTPTNVDNVPDKSPIGLGRPVGSTNIASKRASKKLAQLGFDPIVKMVELHDKLENEIFLLTHDELGLPITTYSKLAHAQLYTALQKTISELLRYGYARATEGIDVGAMAPPPFTINLTATKVDFDTASLIGKGAIYENEDDRPMKGDDE